MSECLAEWYFVRGVVWERGAVDVEWGLVGGWWVEGCCTGLVFGVLWEEGEEMGNDCVRDDE